MSVNLWQGVRTVVHIWFTRTIRCAALPLALIVLAGCSPTSTSTGGATTPEPTGGHDRKTLPNLAGAQIADVLPGATSSKIGTPDSRNIVAIDPSIPANGELFVFLPGTGGQPRCCQLLLKEAAVNGFAAIGLTYPNTTSVAMRCGNDLSCFAPLRQNIFDGEDAGSQSSLEPDNAVEFRLESLLSYLARRQPARWAQFLKGSSVDWSKVVVAGHSQGGGEAAYIGAVEQTKGVALLSAPVDSTNSAKPVPAPYLAAERRSPLDHYVGFDHTADPYFEKITTNWAALSLGTFGQVTSIDTHSAPFSNTHELTTSLQVPHLILLPEHDSTAVDIETPMCPSGTPRFAPVWRYMMEVAGGLPIVSSPNPC